DRFEQIANDWNASYPRHRQFTDELPGIEILLGVPRSKLSNDLLPRLQRLDLSDVLSGQWSRALDERNGRGLRLLLQPALDSTEESRFTDACFPGDEENIRRDLSGRFACDVPDDLVDLPVTSND